MLVTNIRKGFAIGRLACLGVTVRSPDDHLTELLSEFPDDVLGVLERSASGPEIECVEALVPVLERAQCGRFAACVRRLLIG